MDSCNLMENSLSYRIDAVGDSSYAEPSLTDTYRSSSSSSSGSGSYESNIKVASGSSVQTTYSWHENGFTHCSATCLGGMLIFLESQLINKFHIPCTHTHTHTK